MLKQVQLRTNVVTVDLEGDYYGAEFWNKVSNRRYEPDTVGFIEDNCDCNSDFMDIGAANGAMTLIAANAGARVSAYEPDPRIHKVVERNIKLNNNISSLVVLQNKAISSSEGTLNFMNGEDSSILSSIVFTGHDSTSSLLVEVLPIAAEIERFHCDKSRKLIVKMDIEGAEWRILKSEEALESLKANSATLLLAVHPGFYRPFVPRVRGIDRLRLTLWQFRNYRESISTFKSLSKVASIRRTNLNLITKKHQFAALILAGYHEFIIDFHNA